MKNNSSGNTPVVKGDKIASTPMSKEWSTKKENERYPIFICSWDYQVCNRPDVAHIVGKLDRYMCNPGIDCWKAAKKVIWYLQRIKDYMLTYRRSYQLQLIGYTDSDFAGCITCKKSTSGCVFLMVRWAVFWKSVIRHLLLHLRWM